MMYCSKCGKEVNPKLSFCNFCGTRIGGGNDPAKMETSSFNLLLSGTMLVPILGIGALMALLAVMKRGLDFREEMIGIVFVMSVFLLILAEMGLLMLLFRTTKAPKTVELPMRGPKDAGLPEVVIKGIPEGDARGISSMPGSVTEHTTRTLDAVPRDRER